MAGKVTFEDVLAARDRIIARGELPTRRGVHREVGSGSMTTVQRFLKDAEALQIAVPVVEFAPPQELLRSLASWASGLVERAIAAERDRLTAAEKDVNELAEEVAAQQYKLEEQQELEETLRRECAQVEGRLTQMQQERDVATIDSGREREVAEGVRLELARAKVRIEGLPLLEVMLSQARVDLDITRKRVSELETSSAVLISQNQGLEEHLRASKEEALRADELAADLRAQLDERVTDANQFVGELQAQLSERAACLADTRVELEATRGKLLLAEERLAHVQAKVREPL